MSRIPIPTVEIKDMKRLHLPACRENIAEAGRILFFAPNNGQQTFDLGVPSTNCHEMWEEKLLFLWREGGITDTQVQAGDTLLSSSDSVRASLC
ncbi:hypothetical protein BaRGS_00033751 [Batillaria attramentaria]|uniref:Uncharacterized protein n=1 Tax=Batillaria attramentaria TaxID=370345 RepID=A0ABD0JJH1_9CAEN